MSTKNMKKILFPFAALAILLSTYVMPAAAQITGADAVACNAQFAEELVEQQVIESKSVVDPVKRIKILIRSAEFLWKLDQPTARAYFGEAWKMADERFKELGFENKKKEGLTVTQVLPDQRMEVIRAISKRDAAWAKKLSDQMLADLDKSTKERDGFDINREQSDLLRLANESAKTNRELSLYLYRRVMRYPLFNGWFFVFYTVYKDDPAFADALYLETLNNYRDELPSRLLYLSGYPFATERIIGIDKYGISMGPQPDVAPNSALQRQFINTLFTRIANYAASESDINRTPEKYSQPEPIYMVSAIRELEPIIINQLPDLLPRLGLAKAQANSLLSAEMGKTLEEKEKWKDTLGQSFDERLAQLEKADDEGKLTDNMIISLVTWVKKTEEQFIALLPWLDKITDAKARAETINYFWFQRSKLAITEKRYDDAEKYAAKVPETEHRALLFFDLAEQQAKTTTELGNLFETLNSLSKLVRSADGSIVKAQMLMGLSNMYERVNHSIALDELGESIRVTNNLKNPDIFQTSVMRQIVGKDFATFASFQTPGYDLEKTFEDLSKKDFEMSIAHAKSLDDKYFRTLAVIAAAKNCTMNAPPKPKPKK